MEKFSKSLGVRAKEMILLKFLLKYLFSLI